MVQLKSGVILQVIGRVAGRRGPLESRRFPIDYRHIPTYQAPARRLRMVTWTVLVNGQSLPEDSAPTAVVVTRL